MRIITIAQHAVELIQNMGWRYIAFRSFYELKRRTGLLKKQFPSSPVFRQYFSLEEWEQQDVVFFFSDKDSLSVPRKQADVQLKDTFEKIRNGVFTFFSGPEYKLGQHFDWITNPDSGYRYDNRRHWTKIEDYTEEAGDIKFVWEKSRFSYLYDIIRYDYHYQKDCSEFVFDEILSWIDKNPVNNGPNYKCSQEISLRVLNWTFALYYYKNSSFLSPAVFNKIQYAIYWQLRHVYQNINFSRIAVRNNHAITETLTLYLGGLLFPLFPDAQKWKRKGKAWFEREIAYQIYDDGTFLQFSMNYHRVVVQLLTWALRLADLNKERFSHVVLDRAAASLRFLRICMNDENGWLPNYGANDGALFFKLNDCQYRDYRPQLQALGFALGVDAAIPLDTEDKYWYGFDKQELSEAINPAASILYRFPIGGYYLIREPNSLTFFRCGNHKDRPSQADNLHMDIWYKGENILADAGSYKYNTDNDTLKYFMGTASHNTAMLDDFDQMKKGARFIWYNWSQCESAKLYETEEAWVFEGVIVAFQYVDSRIRHKRTVRKNKGTSYWQVEDEILNKPVNMNLKQLWHVLGDSPSIDIAIMPAGNDKRVQEIHRSGWYSSLYGEKEVTEELIFQTSEDKITTGIRL
jgi:hypothetical protein